MNGAPGALEAGAPEFLDFLISESPENGSNFMQKAWIVQRQNRRRSSARTSLMLMHSETTTLLAPLKQPWDDRTPDGYACRIPSRSEEGCPHGNAELQGVLARGG